MKTILLFLAIIPFVSFCQADTVKVWLSPTDCTARSFPYATDSPKPYRIVAKGKNGGGYIDSIRVCNQAIKSDTSQYYLIVYSVDSIKVMEGDFFGTVSNGRIIEYDRYGRKEFEGQTALRYNGRNNTYPYSYPIGTNRTYTYKNRNSTRPKSIIEIVYLPDSRKYIRRVYGADGKVITESKGKR